MMAMRDVRKVLANGLRDPVARKKRYALIFSKSKNVFSKYKQRTVTAAGPRARVRLGLARDLRQSLHRKGQHPCGAEAPPEAGEQSSHA